MLKKKGYVRAGFSCRIISQVRPVASRGPQGVFFKSWSKRSLMVGYWGILKKMNVETQVKREVTRESFSQMTNSSDYSPLLWRTLVVDRELERIERPKSERYTLTRKKEAMDRFHPDETTVNVLELAKASFLNTQASHFPQ